MSQPRPDALLTTARVVITIAQVLIIVALVGLLLWVPYKLRQRRASRAG